MRIPAGWIVKHNSFYALDPGAEVALAGLPGEDPWELFTQDLLQLHDPRAQILVDLGWSPEADPSGAYRLSVVEGERWSEPLLESSHDTRLGAVAAVEAALVAYAKRR